MPDTIIKNGTLVTGRDRFTADIRIEDGAIAGIESSATTGDAAVIDAEGLFVLPGLIHPHCHFRDPGLTHKEDFYTGQRAAAAGGLHIHYRPNEHRTSTN